jgi:hypothetical protein
MCQDCHMDHGRVGGFCAAEAAGPCRTRFQCCLYRSLPEVRWPAAEEPLASSYAAAVRDRCGVAVAAAAAALEASSMISKALRCTCMVCHTPVRRAVRPRPSFRERQQLQQAAAAGVVYDDSRRRAAGSHLAWSLRAMQQTARVW